MFSDRNVETIPTYPLHALRLPWKDFGFLLSEHIENSKSSWIKIHMAYWSILDTAVCLLAWDLFAAYLHVSQIIWHNLTHAPTI